MQRTKRADTIKKYFPSPKNAPRGLDAEYMASMDNALIKRIQKFIRVSFNRSKRVGYRGLAVGLSAGIDSSVSAALAAKAIGSKRVCGVIVDSKFGRKRGTVQKALMLADHLGIKAETVKPDFGVDARRFQKPDLSTLYELNIATRAIQSEIFRIADKRYYAVISTMDKSEELLGRYMEAFYRQIAPLSGLYKTEVYELGKLVHLPDYILREKAGCDFFLDEQVFGAGFYTIDPVLHLLHEKGLSPKRIAKRYGLEEKWINGIKDRIALQKLMTKTRELGVIRESI